MISPSTLDTYRDAFTWTTRNGGEKITVLREPLPDDIQAHLLDILHDAKEKAGDFDLAYEIAAQAVELLPDTIEDLATFDPYDINIESASIYTYDRLQYLNIYNQYDIAQVFKETSSDDIANACAIWYDRIIQETLSDLVDYFINNL